jgi:hypothetical protein
MGRYLLVEATGCSNTTANWLSPIFDFSTQSGKVFVEFWYHLYGADMGMLSLDLSLDGGTSWMNDPFFVPLKDDKNEWQVKRVSSDMLAGKSNVQFRLQGTTAASVGSNTSDIGIDDFLVGIEKEVPTLGVWGLIGLGICLLIIGVVGVKKASIEIGSK